MNWIEAAQQTTADYVDLLRELVAIDSGTYNKKGVDAVGNRFASLLAELGYQIKRYPLDDYGDCIEATLKGDGDGHILLLGHCDTVYPDGTALERPLRVEKGRIIGPGTADMKGGLLLGVSALRLLKELDFRDFGQITFFINSEEEISSPVSRDLYLSVAPTVDVCLVLEAARPEGHIVSARKGTGTVEFVISGKSAHAGEDPGRGASAIEALVRILGELSRRSHEFKPTTFNVGVISGGTRGNVIADHARAVVDIRVEDTDAWEQADAFLHQLAKMPMREGITVQRKGGRNYPPMSYTRATELLVSLAQAQARELNFELPHIASGGGSDANMIVASGTPCLDGLGPQGGANHSPAEYIVQASVTLRTALLASLISRICASIDEIRSQRPPRNYSKADGALQEP